MKIEIKLGTEYQPVVAKILAVWVCDKSSKNKNPTKRFDLAIDVYCGTYAENSPSLDTWSVFSRACKV